VTLRHLAAPPDITGVLGLKPFADDLIVIDDPARRWLARPAQRQPS